MNFMKDRLITEINRTPDALLPEILEFVQFLNQKHLQSKPTTPQGWQPGFFEEVLGGWEGEKLIRDIQSEHGMRG